MIPVCKLMPVGLLVMAITIGRLESIPVVVIGIPDRRIAVAIFTEEEVSTIIGCVQLLIVMVGRIMVGKNAIPCRVMSPLWVDTPRLGTIPVCKVRTDMVEELLNRAIVDIIMQPTMGKDIKTTQMVEELPIRGLGILMDTVPIIATGLAEKKILV